MSDGLENFIRNKRKEFDQFDPPEDVWNRIENNLDSYQKTGLLRRRLNFIFRAAAICIITLAVAVLFLTYEKSRPLNIGKIYPELAKQNMHYASVVETRRNELEEVKNQEPKLYGEFSFELHKLDKAYQRLKKDLETSPNQGATLKAMVLNLQIQAEALNQQLVIIEQIKQMKEAHHNENQGI